MDRLVCSGQLHESSYHRPFKILTNSWCSHAQSLIADVFLVCLRNLSWIKVKISALNRKRGVSESFLQTHQCKECADNADASKDSDEGVNLGVFLVCIERITTLDPAAFYILIPTLLIISHN